MNDENDRLYGKDCVERIINHCDESSILYKYKNIDLARYKRPLYSHYSMSFCLKKNHYLWKEYACNHKGFALCFDLDKLQMAIYDKCGRSFKGVLEDRKISYEPGITEIENTFCDLEKRFFNKCHEKHDKDTLEFIKRLVLLIYTGYTKEAKWKEEEEYRICYVDTFSAREDDAMNEIIRLSKNDHNFPALCKLGLAPKQRQCEEDDNNSKYKLSLGDLLTSSILPRVYIGNACSESLEDTARLLKNHGFSSTCVISERDDDQ